MDLKSLECLALAELPWAQAPVAMFASSGAGRFRGQASDSAAECGISCKSAAGAAVAIRKLEAGPEMDPDHPESGLVGADFRGLDVRGVEVVGLSAGRRASRRVYAPSRRRAVGCSPRTEAPLPALPVLGEHPKVLSGIQVFRGPCRCSRAPPGAGGRPRGGTFPPPGYRGASVLRSQMLEDHLLRQPGSVRASQSPSHFLR
jgi:hypothetical protein